MTYHDSHVRVRDDSHIGVLEETESTTAEHVRAHTCYHEQQASADTPKVMVTSHPSHKITGRQLCKLQTSREDS